MNRKLSQSEAKSILTLLKQGNTAPVSLPEQSQNIEPVSPELQTPVVETPEPEVKTADETPVLTRRNTGITTNSGNIWINPADREWLNKSAAYKDVSWEDYCALSPSETPQSMEKFFN